MTTLPESLIPSDDGNPQGMRRLAQVAPNPVQPPMDATVASLVAASDTNPDEHARGLKLAARSGIKPEHGAAVVKHGQPWQVRRREEMWDAIGEDTPGLAKWLADPHNARLAIDDLSRLRELDGSLKGLTPQRSWLGEIWASGEAGFAGLGASYFHLSHLKLGMDPRKAAEGAAAYNRKVADLEAGRSDEVKAYYRSVARASGLGVAVEALFDVEGLSSLLASNIPFSLPALALGAAGGVGGAKLGATSAAAAGPFMAGTGAALLGAAGAAGGAFTGSLVVEFGAWVNQAIAEAGYDITDPDSLLEAYSDPALMQRVEAEAERKAIATSAVEAVSGVLAGRFLGNLPKGSSMARKALEGGKELAVESLLESTGEAAGQLAATGEVDIDDAILEGVASLGQSGGQIAAGVVRRRGLAPLVRRAVRASQATQDADAIRQSAEAFKASKAAQRYPQRVREYIAGQVADQDSETRAAYIDRELWDDYHREAGESPVEALERALPGQGARAYAEAERSGYVEIPLAVFLEQVAKREGDAEGLVRLARYRPEGLSLAEAEADFEAMATDLEDTVEANTVLRQERKSLEERDAQLAAELEALGTGGGSAEAGGGSEGDSVPASTTAQPAPVRRDEEPGVAGPTLAPNPDYDGIPGMEGKAAPHPAVAVAIQDAELLDDRIRAIGEMPRDEVTDEQLAFVEENAGRSVFLEELARVIQLLDMVRGSPARLADITKRLRDDEGSEVVDEALRRLGLDDPSAASTPESQPAPAQPADTSAQLPTDRAAEIQAEREQIAAELEALTEREAEAVGVRDKLRDHFRAGAAVSGMTPKDADMTADATLAIWETAAAEANMPLADLVAKFPTVFGRRRAGGGVEGVQSGTVLGQAEEPAIRPEVQEFERRRKAVQALEAEVRRLRRMPVSKYPKKAAALERKIVDAEQEHAAAEAAYFADFSPEDRARLYDEALGVYKSQKDAEWAASMKRQRAEEAAARRWDDAQPRLKEYRRAIFAKLRALGFTREHADGGSYYYRHGTGGYTVRISDHEVPMTPERSDSLDQGRFSWADAGPERNLVLDEFTTEAYVLAWLDAVERRDEPGFDPTPALEAAATTTLKQSAPLPPTIDVDGVERPTTNSEGNPIHPGGEEAIRNFWRWFGDSKVVDGQGRPRVVYHGTAASSIEQFDPGKRGGTTQAPSARRAFFFTDSPALASDYATELAQSNPHSRIGALKANAERLERKAQRVGTNAAWRAYSDAYEEYENAALADVLGEGANVLPVYLRMSDPVEKDFGGDAYRDETYNDILARARSAGSSGAVLLNTLDPAGVTAEPVAVFAVFDPADIKSAIGNAGTFDATPRILWQNLEQAKQGATAFGPPDAQGRRTFNVSFFAKANRSTWFHEMGHVWLEMVGDLIDQGVASEGQRADYQTLLDWFGVSSRAEIGTAEHEKFARAFEAYLLEGKAPTPELRSAFASFGRWLTRIYDRLTGRSVEQAMIGLSEDAGFKVELSDDIRGVMDRMFATREAIKEAQDDVGPALLPDAVVAGMEDDERRVYLAKVREAQDTAYSGLLSDVLSSWSAYRSEELEKKAEKLRPEVEAEVNARAAVKAYDRMRLDGAEEGAFRIDPASVPDDGLQARLADMGLLATPEYGGKKVGLESAARQLAERADDPVTPEDFVRALEAASQKGRLIAAETRRRIEAENPELLERADRSEYARERIANAKRAEQMYLELQHARRKLSAQKQATKKAREGRDAQKADRRDVLGSRRTLPQIREAARVALDKVPIKNIRPKEYLAAARREANAAYSRALVGDWAGVVKHHERALFNHEKHREATKRMKRVEATKRLFEKNMRPVRQKRMHRANPAIRVQMNALLARVGYGPHDEDTAQAEWFGVWNRANEAGRAAWDDTRTFDPAPWIENMRAEVRWQDLTTEQLDEVREVAEWLYMLGESADRLHGAFSGLSLSETAERLGGNIEATRPLLPQAQSRVEIERTLAERTKETMRGFDAELMKLATLARLFDDGKAGGLAWEMVIDPLNEGAEIETDRQAAALLRFDEIMAQIPGYGTEAFHKAEPVKGLPGDRLSREQVVGIGLLWGNRFGQERVVAGLGFSDDEVMAILETLTDAELQAISDLRDLYESFWPEIRDLELRMTGVAPSRVPPIHTPLKGGRVLRGGYHPKKYRGSSFVEFTKAEQALHMSKGAVGRSTTKRGFTKDSVEQLGDARKIRTDLRVTTEHLREVIHDLTYRERLLNINRLLAHQKVKQAIENRYGPEYLAMIRETLSDVAAGRGQAALGWFDRMARGAATNAGASILAFRASTGLIQITGLAQTWQEIGAKWTGRGIAEAFHSADSFKRATEFVYERSAMMPQRWETLHDRLREMQERARGEKAGPLTKLTGKYGYFFIQVMQTAVDVPTWLGAFRKFEAEGYGPDKAARMADQVVRDTQGGSDLHDLARIQRSDGFARLATVFYFYGSVIYQRTRLAGVQFYRKDMTPNGLAKMAGALALIYVAPALLEGLFKVVFKGVDDDDEFFTTALSKGGGQALGSLFGTIPGVRGLYGAIEGYRYEGFTGEAVLANATAMIAQLRQGEVDYALGKSIMETLGSLTGKPFAQAYDFMANLPMFTDDDVTGVRALTAPLFGRPYKTR